MIVNFISTNAMVQNIILHLLQKQGRIKPNFPTPISQSMSRTSRSQPSLHFRSSLSSKDFGVSVNARHQAQAYSSSNGFRDFSLVHWSQSSFGGMSNTTHFGHVLGHDSKILAIQPGKK